VTATWKPLPWDSEFFGFPIGRIDFEEVDEASIVACEAEAREQGIQCLYASLTPSDPTASYHLQTLGYRLLEVATTLNLHPSEPAIPRPPDITVRLGTADDLPNMTGLIDSLTTWSRFAHDPRFGPEAARRLQHAWVERAATDTTDDRSLLVAESGGVITAFLTRSRTPEPVIDTIGTTARGSGAAGYLVEHTRAWGRGTMPLGGPIAARNVAALRFVGGCNYRVIRVRYIFHRWLDEVPC
jgi:dTDP-4-amino-4,6-dideoxy-D-galactose acyltransferase